MHLLKLTRALIATLIIAMPVYAEQAPVYEADNYPPFDSVAPNAVEASPEPMPTQRTYTSPPSNNLNQRVARLEQQMQILLTSGNTVKVQVLQSEVQALRGQVEELTHKIQLLQTQQRTQYSDLDKRMAEKPSGSISSTQSPAITSNEDDNVDMTSAKPVTSTKVSPSGALTTTTSVTTVKPTVKSGSQPNSDEEQQIYQTAYNLIKAKKYNEAVKTLQSMLQKYPSGQFASNAHYWLGELYGLMGKNNEALTEFDTVVKNYSDSPRVADAQLKVGMLYVLQSKWPEAKVAFKKVTSRYPGTAPARLAAEQLKQLKEAGH